MRSGSLRRFEARPYGGHTTAHLFIVRPMLGMHLDSLFSTQPPIAKRIDQVVGSDRAVGGLGRAYDYQ